MTYEKATAEGLATAQLPLGDFNMLCGTTVLTVNTMVDLLLHVSAATTASTDGGGDHGESASLAQFDDEHTVFLMQWRAALEAVLPHHKGAAAKDSNSSKGSNCITIIETLIMYIPCTA